MNVTQCRMARAALRWTLDDLASASGVARRTIARYEAGHFIMPEGVSAIRRAFEDTGVQFIDSGKLAGGIVPPSSRG